jgi:hypothetical protein
VIFFEPGELIRGYGHFKMREVVPVIPAQNIGMAVKPGDRRTVALRKLEVYHIPIG